MRQRSRVVPRGDPSSLPRGLFCAPRRYRVAKGKRPQMTLDDLEILRREAKNSLELANNLESLQAWDRDVLGAKGSLSTFLRGLGKASPEERPALGRAANEVKTALVTAFEARKSAIQDAALD